MNSSEVTELLNNGKKIYYDGLSSKVWVYVEKERIGATAYFGVKGNKTTIRSKWYPGGIPAVVEFLAGAGIVEE